MVYIYIYVGNQHILGSSSFLEKDTYRKPQKDRTVICQCCSRILLDLFCWLAISCYTLLNKLPVNYWQNMHRNAGSVRFPMLIDDDSHAHTGGLFGTSHTSIIYRKHHQSLPNGHRYHRTFNALRIHKTNSSFHLQNPALNLSSSII